MAKTTIYKNKGETFDCHFNIEGTDINDVVVRLCLEFEDNKNLFFYGNVNKDGSCQIKIPKLTETPNREGRLIIEAIADSTYFQLYECEVEIKSSMEIKMENFTPSPMTPNSKPASDKKVLLSDIKRTETVIEESETFSNPYLLRKKLNK